MDDRKFTNKEAGKPQDLVSGRAVRLVTDKLGTKYEKTSGMKFPKALCENEYFKGLSAEAIIIYCVMMDCEKISRKMDGLMIRAKCILCIRWNRLCSAYIVGKRKLPKY